MENKEIELKIKVMYDDEIIIHCHEEDTVKELKTLLSEKTSIPVEQQKLIFLGRVLADEKSLRECNVKDRCVLSLAKVTVRFCDSYLFFSLDLQLLLKPLRKHVLSR